VTRICGQSWVEAVEVRDCRGATRSIETDGVIVSGDFQPEATLVRDSHLAFDPHSRGPACDQYMRLSDPYYFAAGNLLRPVETAGWCWAEGKAAAHMIVRSLAGELPEQKAMLSMSLASDAIKYVVPQRVVGAGPASSRHLQLRVKRPVHGWV